MPVVAIDARMIGEVPHGIARYVKNLAFGLERLGGLRYDPVFLVSEKGRSQLPASFRTLCLRSPFLSARELIEVSRELKSLAPDLYHSPSFSSLIHSPCPWLVTIHDLNHLRFGGLREKVYYRAILKPFALGARRVVTVSEFSQRQIATWLKRPVSQIEIVYNAVDPLFCESDISGPESSNRAMEALRKHHLQPRNYFTFFSHHSKPHKNSDFLLSAYFEARRREPSLPFLAVNATREELSSLGMAPGTSGLICLGKIPDTELKPLLQHARAVLFPSSFEGFGLPPLEAAILGARVLVSDIPPHREALVDFSPPQLQWLNPADSESWIQALVRLLGPEAAQADHSASPEQVARAEARFSVRGLAEHMDRIYRAVLQLG